MVMYNINQLIQVAPSYSQQNMEKYFIDKNKNKMLYDEHKGQKPSPLQ